MSVRICSQHSSAEERGEGRDVGHAARSRRARPRPLTMFCSEMPNWMKRSGMAPLRSRRGRWNTCRSAVQATIGWPCVGELDQRVGEQRRQAGRPVELSVCRCQAALRARGPALIAAPRHDLVERARLVLGRRDSRDASRARSPCNETPLPLTVWAMTHGRRAARAGRPRCRAAARRAPRRRGRRPRATSQPKARHLSASGSMPITSSTLPSSW